MLQSHLPFKNLYILFHMLQQSRAELTAVLNLIGRNHRVSPCEHSVKSTDKLSEIAQKASVICSADLRAIHASTALIFSVKCTEYYQ